jgi:signal transduction histidine kinase
MWSIPFLITAEILFAGGVLLAVYLTHAKIELIYSSYILIVNILFIAFYTRKLITSLGAQTKKLTSVIQEQDKSAKMLIRRDIELTRANEKLKGLDTQKSEFMSIIAHQMRTPLSAIKWTMNMMLKNELGPLTIDQMNFLKKADESNEHMINLVEDMLLADRLESGRSDINLIETDLNAIIDDVLHDLTQKIQLKNIQVHRSACDPIVCSVKADKEKIRAVIQNLLENAVKYTTQDGAITVQLYERDGFVCVSIKDSGIGIPKDQQAYIFGKFYRARNAARVEANGSGLGLFIAKNIIERHGGTITCDSEEGKGTTFTFTIKKT